MQLNNFASVPIWQSELPNFKNHQKPFIDLLYKLRNDMPNGVQISNVNGYHSPSILQNVPELGPLFDYIGQMTRQACVDMNFVDCDVYITTAWSNFNDNRSCMNVDHVHGETFSGCFYLQIPKDSGKLVISNPGINRMWQGCTLVKEQNQFTVEAIRLEPTEGQILLWPSYLYHAVTTNNHDLPRISLAFNIIAVPKDRNDEKVDRVEKVGLKKFNSRYI
jgi:uncharacterized protein (TIGR02466 family)